MKHWRLELILLICIILAAVALTRLPLFGVWNGGTTVTSVATSTNENAATSTAAHYPVRNLSVLDPHVTAHAMIVQSLDDDFPFFHAVNVVKP